MYTRLEIRYSELGIDQNPSQIGDSELTTQQKSEFKRTVTIITVNKQIVLNRLLKYLEKLIILFIGIQYIKLAQYGNKIEIKLQMKFNLY